MVRGAHYLEGVDTKMDAPLAQVRRRMTEGVDMKIWHVPLMAQEMRRFTTDKVSTRKMDAFFFSMAH
ncbi:hypothetical protein KI387_036968, partial [Taxus chinensis]